MKPSQIGLQWWGSVSGVDVQKLVFSVELQKRINCRQFEIVAMRNLIMELKNDAIQQLREQFIHNKNIISLEQFMWLILHSLSSWKILNREMTIDEEFGRYQQEYHIVKLFEDIDRECCNAINWEQFLNYITSASMMKIKDNAKCSSPSIATLGVSQLSFSHQEKSLYRKNSIKTIIEIVGQKMLAILQKKSDTLTFLSIQDRHVSQPYQLCGVDMKKVLSIDYSVHEKIYGVLLNASRIVFVVDGPMQRIYESKLSGNELQIVYLPIHRLWVLIYLDNSIEVFSLPESNQKLFENRRTVQRYKPHNANLLPIRQIEHPLVLLTGSTATEIKLWKVQSNQLIGEINPCKQEDLAYCKSIKGFEVFSGTMVSYVICWMFVNEISVWKPSEHLTEPYLGKLVGHTGMVQSAHFFSHFPFVVSIDTKSMVKVWNIQNLYCIQTIKLQFSSTPNIKILKSLPFILFYEKGIQFYLCSREQNMRELRKQIRVSKVQVERIRKYSINKQYGNSKKEEINGDVHRQIQESRTNIQKRRYSADLTHSPIVTKPITNHLNTHNEDSQKILQICYDTYHDYLLILTKSKLAIIGINSGAIIKTTVPHHPQQVFVTMCLKGNRSLFVANNLAEIICFNVEDCSVVHRLQPFNASGRAIKTVSELQMQIIRVDYNVYNKVLLVISQQEGSSSITTYDIISQTEAVQKKQISTNQINICGYCSAAYYNLFYVGSNDPGMVSIWDYHNFVVLRVISIPSPIKNLRCESEQYNLLIITEQSSIRVLQLHPIPGKNNTQQPTKNLIVTELLLQSATPLITTELLHTRKQIINTHQHPNNLPPGVDISEWDAKPGDAQWFLYVHAESGIQFGDVSKYIEKLTIYAEPFHSSKANITKQFKQISITPVTYTAQQSIIKLENVINNTIINSPNNVNKLGKVNDFIYFMTENGILNFYRTDKKCVGGKIALPHCEIIQWPYPLKNLLPKILSRLKKAEEVSKLIHLNKKNKMVDENKLQEFRMFFIVDMYFKGNDREKIGGFLERMSDDGKGKQENGEIEIGKQCDWAHHTNYLSTHKQPNQLSHQSPPQKKKLKTKISSLSIKKLKQIQKKYMETLALVKPVLGNKSQSLTCLSWTTKNKQIGFAKSTSIQPTLTKKLSIIFNHKHSQSTAFQTYVGVSKVNKIKLQNLKKNKDGFDKVQILKLELNEQRKL